MQEEQAKNENADTPNPSDAPATDEKREMSTIQFPYGDLDDAMALAKAVHEVGGQSCLAEQLAGYLKVAPTGGAFRARLAHPRIFGLIEYDKGTVSLTPLGLRSVDQTQEAQAKVDAFLTVPLYKSIYDKYKGYTLPPPAALEREIHSMGVSSKQKDKARQVFERSAKQAGFYWAGNDRLTLPVTKAKPETMPISPPPEQPIEPAVTNKGGNGGGGYHPFIDGLLKTLPPTDSEWPVKDRAKWLKLAANAFDLIYKGEGEIEIKVTAE